MENDLENDVGASLALVIQHVINATTVTYRGKNVGKTLTSIVNHFLCIYDG